MKWWPGWQEYETQYIRNPKTPRENKLEKEKKAEGKLKMLLLIQAPLQSFEIFYFPLTKWLFLLLRIIIFLLLVFLSFSQENDTHEHYLAYEFIFVYFHLFLYFETWLSLCELGSLCPVSTQQSNYSTDNCSVSFHVSHLGNSVTYS